VGARSVHTREGFLESLRRGRRWETHGFRSGSLSPSAHGELAHDHFVTDRTYLDNLTIIAPLAEHLEADAMDVFVGAMPGNDLVFQLPLSVMQDTG